MIPNNLVQLYCSRFVFGK